MKRTKTRSTLDRRMLVAALLLIATRVALAPAAAHAQEARETPASARPEPESDACPQAEWSAMPPQPLPGLARTLAVPGAPVTVAVLGPLQSGGRSGAAGAAGAAGAVNYPARLQALLGEAWPGRAVRVESIGKPRGNVHEQYQLIDRRVLPLRPALVIWQVGRADARGAVPSNRFGHMLLKGIAALKGGTGPVGAIDTILMTMQFHPNSEALYRTDEYRNTIAWVGRTTGTPVVDRFSMIEHWWSSGFVDLDSQDPAVQKHGVDTIQRCIAVRLAAAIVAGAVAAAADAPDTPNAPNAPNAPKTPAPPGSPSAPDRLR